MDLDLDFDLDESGSPNPRHPRHRKLGRVAQTRLAMICLRGGS